jgi:hypothetical protein
MFRKRIFKSIAVAALLALAAHAQGTVNVDTAKPDTANSGAPNKGRQAIDKAVAALGGDRFLHMKSRVSSGRIYAFFHDQISGLDLAKIYIEYLPETPPGAIGMRERELLGKKQDYSYLFLTNQGWDVTFRGARPIPDEDWERFARTTENDILYLLRLRLNEPGMQFDYVGSEIYLSRHVEVVDITDAKDQTIRVYFDHNTSLPVHQTFNWIDPVTRQHNDEVTEYDKYRDAGGVMWPFTIEREKNGYKVYQMFAEQVQIDQSLPPRIFDLPPGVKVLKKVN